jgi:hypothetical protein
VSLVFEAVTIFNLLFVFDVFIICDLSFVFDTLYNYLIELLITFDM